MILRARPSFDPPRDHVPRIYPLNVIVPDIPDQLTFKLGTGIRNHSWASLNMVIEAQPMYFEVLTLANCVGSAARILTSIRLYPDPITQLTMVSLVSS